MSVSQQILGPGSSPTFAGLTLTGTDTATHHETSTSTTPTLTINPSSSNGAGSGATGSISGRDQVISVSLTTGTTPSAGQQILAVTFGQAFTNTPAVVPIPTNANAVNPGSIAKLPYLSAVSTTGFTLSAGATGLTASTTYTWTFAVVG